MLVSFEVRILLVDQQKRRAMLRRGNIWTRFKRRVLIPIGGGINVIDEDFRFSNLIGNLTVKDDLRFAIEPDNLRRVGHLYKRLTPGRILGEAKREFAEETVTERRIFLPNDIRSCDYTYVGKRMFEAISVASKTWGEPTIYCVGIVQVHPTEAMLYKLQERCREVSDVEFVPGPLFCVEGGSYTKKASLIPPVYKYLA